MKFFYSSIIFDDGVCVFGVWGVDKNNNVYFNASEKNLYLAKHFDCVKDSGAGYTVKFTPESPYYKDALRAASL